MMYTVYFTWNDGTEDSFNCANAYERDFNIDFMLNSQCYSRIEYCKFYKNGEHGRNIKVL